MLYFIPETGSIFQGCLGAQLHRQQSTKYKGRPTLINIILCGHQEPPEFLSTYFFFFSTFFLSTRFWKRFTKNIRVQFKYSSIHTEKDHNEPEIIHLSGTAKTRGPFPNFVRSLDRIGDPNSFFFFFFYWSKI